jgi:hypothetical protein
LLKKNSNQHALLQKSSGTITVYRRWEPYYGDIDSVHIHVCIVSGFMLRLDVHSRGPCQPGVIFASVYFWGVTTWSRRKCLTACSEVWHDRFAGSTRRRSSGLNYVNQTSYLCACPWFCWWSSALGSDAQCSAGTTVTTTCGGAVVLPVASALPLGKLGLGVGRATVAATNLVLGAVAPLPVIVLRDRGPPAF